MKYREFDEALGTPARLAILATVAEHGRSDPDEPMSFMELRRATGLADGNLHVQTRKLCEVAYLTSFRRPQGNRLVTCFALTEAGRRALRNLFEQLGAALGEREVGIWERGLQPDKLPTGEASRVW